MTDTTHWYCECGAVLNRVTAREHVCPPRDPQPCRLSGEP